MTLPNMKQRWADAGRIAEVFTCYLKPDHPLYLKVTKAFAQTFLVSKLAELNWLRPVLEGQEAAVFEVVASPFWEDLLRSSKLKIAEEQRTAGEDADGKYVMNQKGEKMYDQDIMRLGIWFIRMCGNDPSLAKCAIDAGGSVVSKGKGLIQ